MGQKKGQLEELICTIADLKTENQHLKRLLSDTKLAIKDAKQSLEHQMYACVGLTLDKTVAALKANGVKDLFALNFDL